LKRLKPSGVERIFMLRRALAILPLVLAASGCTEFSYFRDGAATALATPGTGLLPPTVNPISEVNQKLRDLPPPKQSISAAQA
jgi:curli production assembly/transport component CsgG